MPFFWNDLFKIIKYYKSNKISFLIIVISFLFLFFLNFHLNLFSVSSRGGGVFIKLAKYMDINLDMVVILGIQSTYLELYF